MRIRKRLFSVYNFSKTILVLLNENYVFSRPLSVTGAYFLPTRRIDGIDYAEEVFFHQMTLDRIENGEYVLQNTQFSVNHPPGKIKICYKYN